MIAGFKGHVGLYPHTTAIEHFADRIKDYKTGSSTIQFPFGEPLPKDLIIEMVRYRKSLLEE